MCFISLYFVYLFFPCHHYHHTTITFNTTHKWYTCIICIIKWIIVVAWWVDLKMNALLDISEVPFSFLRLPRFKLRAPKVYRPSAMVVFGFLFLSYFLVLSGIIYDIIVEPPSIGSTTDENGNVRPQAFLQYRVNGQFIIEGLSAGAMFAIGGIGFILLDFSNGKDIMPKLRYLLIIAGFLCILLAYNLCIVFLRMKIPGYMQS